MMRWISIWAVVLLFLAAGCANNRARPGLDAAPSSQAAGLSGDNSGWSVPPGAKSPPAADRTPATGKAAAEAGQATHEGATAPAVANAPQAGHTSGSAGASSAAGHAPVTRDTQAPHVAPLVPAFPVAMQPERGPELKRVHFGFDRWDITAEQARILDRNAKWMLDHPGVGVRIEGHTDERGTSEYNLALGERRAKAVREYLIRKGVPMASLSTVSYGEEMPLEHGHNEQAWAANRRAEFDKVEHPRVTEQQTPSAGTPRGKM